MSSELTPELELFKAVPGSGEPFRTTDLNDNADKLDAFAAAVNADGWVTSARIGANAVGASAIASGAVGSSELANNSVNANHLQANSVGADELQSGAVTVDKVSSLSASSVITGVLGTEFLADDLDLSGKTVSVATQDLEGVPGDLVASTSYAWGIADAVAASAIAADADARNTPVRFASGVKQGTPSSGNITVSLAGFGFTTTSAQPSVVATIINPAASTFVIGTGAFTISGTDITAVTFKILTSTGANATVLTNFCWQVVQY